MTIMGLEAVVYGVDEVDTCAKFFADLGLETREAAAAGATLAVAGENTRVHLRKMTESALPAAIEPGPTLREIVWAVSDKAALQKIGAELGKDRKVSEDADGVLHALGPQGVGLAFAVTAANRETAPAAMPTHKANERARHYSRAVPDHLGHLGLSTPNIDEIAAFYMDRLGFTLSDTIKGFGKFVRAPGSINHHSVFISRRDKPGMQHLSFRLANIDELGVGMAQMEMKGWKKLWGPGRHGPGSDMFVFFRNPAGATVEYHCDEDFIVDPAAWQPREWEPQTITRWGGRPPPEMVGGSPLGQALAADTGPR